MQNKTPSQSDSHCKEKRTVPVKNVLSSGVVFLQYVNESKKNQARILRKRSTLAEKTIWAFLRNRKLDGLKFRRQQIIAGFITDFYCEDAQLAIELDGPVHDNPQKFADDRHKEEVFTSKGIFTLRFRNDEVISSLDRCLEEIRNTARKRKGE